MKKVSFISTLTILGLATIGSTTVLAAEAPSQLPYGSYGKVSFEASQEGTTPTDPTDPEKPIIPTPTDPSKPIQPGTAGPLSIDFASSFDFGQQKISSQDKDYYAAPQKFKVIGDYQEKIGPNYVQVTDNRGTEAGWKLTVTNSEFINTEAPKDKQILKGAQIVFENENIQTVSESAAPTLAHQVVLNAEKETDLMEAQTHAGAGTFLLDWGTDEASAGHSVKLHVPGKTTKFAGSYESTLTWNLTSTPGNI